MAFVACGGGGGGGTPPPPPATLTFTVGGTVTGPVLSTLSLQLNDNPAYGIAVSANGAFQFPASLPAGTSYAVAIGAQPYLEQCSVDNGTGTIGSANVNNVSVTCILPTYSMSGTVSGDTAPGLVLGDGSDFVPVNAGGTSFSFPPTAFVSPLSVVYQPAGLACAFTQGPAFSSSDGTPVQSSLSNLKVSCQAQGFQQLIPFPVAASQFALDPAGNVFLFGDGIQEIKFGNGTYAARALTIAGISAVSCEAESLPGIAVDAADNILFTQCTDAVFKIPLQNGRYGIPFQIASGFGVAGPIAIDSSGNVYVLDIGTSAVTKVPFANGVYGLPAQIATGFDEPLSIAADASQNVFVGDYTGNVYEVPYSNGVYGSQVVVGSFGTNFTASGPSGFVTAAVDANDNLFVWGQQEGGLQEIPFESGHYGAPVFVNQTVNGYAQVGLSIVAATPETNVIVGPSSIQVMPPVSLSSSAFGSMLGGTTAAPPPFSSMGVDALGNVYLPLVGKGIERLPLTSGGYGAPDAILSGDAVVSDMAVDGAGDVYLLLAPAAPAVTAVIRKISYADGKYATPLVVDSTAPAGTTRIAADASGNIFLETMGTVARIPYTNGAYGAIETIAASSSTFSANGIAVDSNDNVYALNGASGVVKIAYANGVYGAPVIITPSVTAGNLPGGGRIAVDSFGNLYVPSGDTVVTEIPYLNGAYGAPVTVSGSFSSPSAVGFDAIGGIYVLDSQAVWRGGP